jgi:translation initiation factor 1 (eIF-1/SUI1)
LVRPVVSTLIQLIYEYFYVEIDLKKASKQFSSKFATGSSVTKNAQGQEEIIVQGDVSDEILEMIEGGVGVLKGIPAENVEFIGEKNTSGPIIDLNLNCWVVGQGAQNVFTVKILERETVSTLKEEIKNKNPEFQAIAADSLVLWKVGGV